MDRDKNSLDKQIRIKFKNSSLLTKIFHFFAYSGLYLS